MTKPGSNSPSPRPGPASASAPRIVLRHPDGRDRDAVVRLIESSREHLIPWWANAEAQDAEGFDPSLFFDRVLASARLPASRRFLMCLRETDEIVGAVSLSNIVRGPFESCTIGYWCGAAHARRGYTTEGVALALRVAFRELRLHRAEANIMPRNEPSTRLVRRLGFRDEGLAKRYLRINYAWEDHVRWGMTIEDYDALVASGVMPFATFLGTWIR
jgi:ribosomal-protein-alanine N-acetyltransferase